MNREQRRKYAKKIKNDKIASVCPACGNKARFFTTARGEKDTVLKCEVCGSIIRDGEELTKLMPPGLYLPVPLAILDRMLIEEAQKIEEDTDEQTDPSEPVAVEGEVT